MPGTTVLLAAMSLGFGGAETHVVSLARVLSRRGHRVLVASQGGPLVASLESEAIPHFHLPLHSRNPLRLGRAVRVMSEILGDGGVDLVHAHARIPAWVTERARARGPGVPLVTTYHGLYSARPPWRWFTCWGDSVIAVSPDVASHLAGALGLSGKPLAVVPNGIDTSEFRPDPDSDARRRELGLPAGVPIVTHVSRLSGDFADVAFALLRTLPALAPRFAGMRLVIVGTGDRAAALDRSAADVNDALGYDAVWLAGGRSDVVPYLAASTVVVGVARSALEAAACGRPVIIAGEGGFRGILDRGTAPLLKRHNFTARGSDMALTPDLLSRDLERVLGRPGLARELGDLGRRVVEKDYDLERSTDRIEAIYREVLDR